MGNTNDGDDNGGGNDDATKNNNNNNNNKDKDGMKTEQQQAEAAAVATEQKSSIPNETTTKTTTIENVKKENKQENSNSTAAAAAAAAAATTTTTTNENNLEKDAEKQNDDKDNDDDDDDEDDDKEPEEHEIIVEIKKVISGIAHALDFSGHIKSFTNDGKRILAVNDESEDEEDEEEDDFASEDVDELDSYGASIINDPNEAAEAATNAEGGDDDDDNVNKANHNNNDLADPEAAAAAAATAAALAAAGGGGGGGGNSEEDQEKGKDDLDENEKGAVAKNDNDNNEEEEEDAPSDEENEKNNNHGTAAASATTGAKVSFGGDVKDEDDEEQGGDGTTNTTTTTTRGGFVLSNPNKTGGINFLHDKIGHQTYGRRIAMYLSKRYVWYNPQLAEKKESTNKKNVQEKAKEGIKTNNNNEYDDDDDDDDDDNDQRPSLAKAWAFFEHVTLNRYEVPTNHRSMSVRGLQHKPLYVRLYNIFFRGERSIEKAEPGENEIPTKLYSPFHTPLSQLGDFGLGYGLYFSALWSFAFLSLIAGFINIPSMMYYGGGSYDVTGSAGAEGFMEKGSAICEDRSWVPCPTCHPLEFQSFGAYNTLSVIFAFKTIEGQGKWLNVSDYITYDFEISEYRFTDDWSERLYRDYQIQASIGSDYINVEDYGTLFCDGACTEHIICEVNEIGYCYLNLSTLPTIPPYAKSDRFFFAKKTNCEGATRKQGFLNLATILFFMVGTVVIYKRQKMMAVKFDEDEQTAQDYSILVLNPPPDAHDPDEWKEFFEKNFENCHVTVCTVDVENDDMQKLFIHRREILKQLELALPPGTPLDMKTLEEEAEKAKVTKEGCLARMASSPIPKLVPKLKEVTEAIKTELKKETDFPSTSVFVTFETEAAQRDVLTKLSLGSLAVARNDANALPDPKYLFRGNLVLEVDEPEEPSAIIWEDLNAKKISIVKRLLVTNLITFALLIVGFVIILALYQNLLSLLASIATTVCTIIFPMIAKSLADYEYHRSESSRQKWMFIKISIFNIALTTVLLSMITPFTATLDAKEGSTLGLIPAVHALFYSQLIITPAIQLLDPAGHVNRHLVAPRAKTQEAMNMNFRGSEIFLSERYANMMKFLYLMVWYCAIYPGAFFMGSLALFVVYFTDRFSLMRTWARTPQVGSQIADFARNYFVPTAIVLMAVFSSYAWSGFPYDKLCEDNDIPLNPDYAGDWFIEFKKPDRTFLGISVASFPNLEVGFEISSNANVYKYCQQDLRAAKGRSFPPLASRQPEGSEWMTQDQEDVLQVYGWTAVVFMIVVIVFFIRKFFDTVWSAFKSSYKPVGEDKQENFSQLRSVDGYVPQKQSPFFAYPLLMCDLSDIDPSLFSWSDPDKPHTYYSLYEDMKEIMDPKEIKIAHVFGDVKHWLPKS